MSHCLRVTRMLTVAAEYAVVLPVCAHQHLDTDNADNDSNFFAEKVFDKQMYEMAEQIHPYEDYAAGKLVKDRSQTTQPVVTLQTIRRGRSSRADKFLDLLVRSLASCNPTQC